MAQGLWLKAYGTGSGLRPGSRFLFSESPDRLLRRELDRGVAFPGADLHVGLVRSHFDLADLAVHLGVLGLIADDVVGAGVADDAAERERDVVLEANHEAAGIRGQDVRAVLAGVEGGRARGVLRESVGVRAEAVDQAAAVNGIERDAAPRQLRRHGFDSP